MKGHFHSNVAAGLNRSRFRPPVSNWELLWCSFHEKLLCKVMNLKNVPYLCVNFLFLSKLDAPLILPLFFCFQLRVC